MITLKLNGREVRAQEGQTILEVAREHGIRIPTLCYLEGLSPRGSCRLCLVEVRNWGGKLVPACATQVEEGMDVVTHNERINRIRRLVLEMLFVERNHICAFCVSSGHCELQDLAVELGMDHVTLPYRYPGLAMDLSHEDYESTTTAVSSVVGVCGPAPRWRGRSPGVSRAGGSRSRWPRTSVDRGGIRRPAPLAGSASRLAPPGPYSRREWGRRPRRSVRR